MTKYAVAEAKEEVVRIIFKQNLAISNNDLQTSLRAAFKSGMANPTIAELRDEATKAVARSERKKAKAAKLVTQPSIGVDLEESPSVSAAPTTTQAVIPASEPVVVFAQPAVTEELSFFDRVDVVSGPYRGVANAEIVRFGKSSRDGEPGVLLRFSLLGTAQEKWVDTKHCKRAVRAA